MQYLESRTHDEISVGDTAHLGRVLSGDDVSPFGAAAADACPPPTAGMPPDHAGASSGIWGGALIFTVIETLLPGPGTILVEQNLRFLGPVAPGDTIEARVTVSAKDDKAGRIRLTCGCTNQNGVAVIEGEAVVVAPGLKIRRPRFLPSDIAPPHAEPIRPGTRFEALIAKTRDLPSIRTAVVHPCDSLSLQGAVRAAEAGMIRPILVGPRDKIAATAAESGLDISGFESVDVPHSHAAAERAVALVRAGKADMLMKGKLHTDELMAPVIDAGTGLRTESRMSHVFALDVPLHDRMLFITDAAINIFPDLETKRDIVQNAINLAHALGLDLPKVALLSAVETVYPKIPSTIDAAALCKMLDRGQITGGLLDGPLAFDNAVSKVAAAAKGITSEVAGEADILVVPDLEAGNMVAKQLIYLAGADAAGIVLGARVPIVLTSRADGVMSRLASTAMASLLAARTRPMPA